MLFYIRIFLLGLLVVFWLNGVVTGQLAMGWSLIFYLFTGGRKTIYLAYHSAGRDMRGAFRYIRLLCLVYYFQKLNLTVSQAFNRTVKKHPRKPALIFEDQVWTFQDLEEYSNRVAHFFLRSGYKPGQCVALFMENRIEFVGIWLGCTKIGLVPALINSNLVGQPLLHSINAASAKALIAGTEFLETVQQVKDDMTHVKVFTSGHHSSSLQRPSNLVNLDEELTNSPTNPVPPSVQTCSNFNDKLLYIFTSGTTGLPKAAVIKHSR